MNGISYSFQPGRICLTALSMQLFLFTNFRLILPSSEEILMQTCINFNGKRDVSKLVTKNDYGKVVK